MTTATKPPTAAELMEASAQKHRLIMESKTASVVDAASHDYTVLVAAAAIVGAIDRQTTAIYALVEALRDAGGVQ